MIFSKTTVLPMAMWVIPGLLRIESNNIQIFKVSIYTKAAYDDGESFGEHNHAFRYHGKPDYNKIISTKVADDYIERIPSTSEQTREILILSTSLIWPITDQNTNIVIKLPCLTD
jgi:hypothetical protein